MAPLSVSDIINVVLCILSFILAAISVVAVVITLKQNNIMIENSTRPYVVFSYEVIAFSASKIQRYIVIKNYGQSSAKITSVECDGLENERISGDIKKMKDTTLAPGQRRLYYIGNANEGQNSPSVNLTISYCASKKNYTDSYELQLNVGISLSRVKDESASSICYVLQEIAERLI